MSAETPTSLTVPKSERTVMLFGGTFDPPTLAHVKIAVAARAAAESAAWLAVTPAARSPHKHHGPIAPDADRVSMARLAFRDIQRCTIWTDEVDRAVAEPGSPSFTIDTVRRAQHVFGPDVRLRLLIGSDQAAAFHRWKDARAIIEAAEPLVFVRAPDHFAANVVKRLRAASFWSDPELQAWRCRILALRPVAGSATEVRRLLAARDHRVTRLVDPEVLAWIESRSLYRHAGA